MVMSKNSFFWASKSFFIASRITTDILGKIRHG